MIGLRTWYAIGASLGALVMVVVWLVEPEGSGEVRARLSLAESMEIGDAGDFERALERRDFTFPADHGPHPDFRTEWWYFTGNLVSANGGEFGYQLTFFSSGLATDRPEKASRWHASRIFMGHLGVSDLVTGDFRSKERFSRAAAGLAGAEAEPLRVWIEDWSLTSGSEPETFVLRASTGDVGIELTLESAREIVLQGDEGLSRKGSEPGNASYYYSIPRLTTTGQVEIDGERTAVGGLSWMDREWSTSALERGQSGWDWFALQLDDGSDLMLYRLRRDDGTTDPASGGSLVLPGGAVHPLTADSVDLAVTETWKSPTTETVYPSAWTVRIPAHELVLEVTPRLSDQEHDLSILYWEGAVEASGSRADLPVAGKGYVELTGYSPEGP